MPTQAPSLEAEVCGVSDFQTLYTSLQLNFACLFILQWKNDMGLKHLTNIEWKLILIFWYSLLFFCCLVEQFLMEKKRKNELIFLDEEDFDFLWEG